MHRTHTGEKIKALKAESSKAASSLAAAHKLAESGIDVRSIIESLENQKKDTVAEAERLKSSGLSRLEDIKIFKVAKTTKGNKSNEYWHASWRNGTKVRNVYLGSCKKMDQGLAYRKARELKAQDLGIDSVMLSALDL